MFRICLINMPFAALNSLSIGLAQLKSVLDDAYGDRVSVEVLYLSHDFAHFFGVDLYQSIAQSGQHHNTALGDWLLRQVAFPDLPDNTQEYLARYYPFQDEQTKRLKATIREQRPLLDEFLDELLAKYRLDEADIVGFTSMFVQNVACFAMAKKIKERNPAVITVLGGANCEAPMGQKIVRSVEQIDFVFSGPGLKSFRQFVDARLSGEFAACHRINGVFSKQNLVGSNSGCEEPVSLARSNTVGPIGEETDINVNINLDYESFLNTLDHNFPGNQIEPVLAFETSRGCWWGEKAHCTFCGLNGMTMSYRAMEPQNALRQFEELFKYADRCNHFNCVDNIMPKSYVKDVFPHLTSPADASIFYEVKADLSEEDMQVLTTARVKIVQPGVEALATSTLKLMKKGTSAFQNLNLLKNCLVYDIFPEWNLLLGFPGEEEDVFRKYVRYLPLLTHLPPPSGAYPVRFDRYSPYFVKAKEYGLLLQPADYYKLIYPFEDEMLADFAYYFVDRNRNAKYFLSVVKWIGKIKEGVERWRGLWRRADQARYPQLFFKEADAVTTIYDSRTGQAVEHSVSNEGLKILKDLNKPKRLPDLASSQFDLEKEISLLQEKGLLFEEGGRYLSLVLPKELPPLSYIKV